MLNEIYDAIGEEKINNYNNKAKLKNMVVCLIKNDGLKTFSVKDSSSVDGYNMSDLDNIKYVEERLSCIRYISSNKAIVLSSKKDTVRLVTSANKFSIMFNISTFFSKISSNTDEIDKEDIKTFMVKTIDEYYDGMKVYTDNIEDEKLLMNKYVDDIADVILKKDNRAKALLVLIDKPVREYKEEFSKYYNVKLFDETFEDGVGKLSIFATLNAKKPLLSSVGGIVEEVGMYTVEEASKLYMLNQYMYGNFKKENKLKTNGAKNENNIKIKYDPKDKLIVDYDQNPYTVYSDDLTVDMIIGPVICKIDKELKIKTYSDLLNVINVNCGFALSSLSKVNSDKKLLYYKYNNIIEDIFEYEGKRIYRVDKELLNLKIVEILDDMIKINKIDKSFNKDNIGKMRYLVNLKLQVNEYFNNRGVVKVSELREIQEDFKKRLGDTKNSEPFESVEAAMYAAGQLAYYLACKSKSKLTSRLISKYHNVKTYEKLEKYLSNDINKYSYDIHMFGRELTVYSAIKSTLINEETNKISKRAFDFFEIGLFGSNLFFKDKSKKESEAATE